MARKVVNEGATGDQPMSAINVTSLVDVMFCLLIMFMVATPLMTPDGVDVDVPAGRGEEITEEEFFYSIISVDKTGKVFLGTLPLSQETLLNPKCQAAASDQSPVILGPIAYPVTYFRFSVHPL